MGLVHSANQLISRKARVESWWDLASAFTRFFPRPGFASGPCRVVWLPVLDFRFVLGPLGTLISAVVPLYSRLRIHLAFGYAADLLVTGVLAFWMLPQQAAKHFCYDEVCALASPPALPARRHSRCAPGNREGNPQALVSVVLKSAAQHLAGRCVRCQRGVIPSFPVALFPAARVYVYHNPPPPLPSSPLSPVHLPRRSLLRSRSARSRSTPRFLLPSTARLTLPLLLLPLPPPPSPSPRSSPQRRLQS